MTRISWCIVDEISCNIIDYRRIAVSWSYRYRGQNIVVVSYREVPGDTQPYYKACVGLLTVYTDYQLKFYQWRLTIAQWNLTNAGFWSLILELNALQFLVTYGSIHIWDLQIGYPWWGPSQASPPTRQGFRYIIQYDSVTISATLLQPQPPITACSTEQLRRLFTPNLC